MQHTYPLRKAKAPKDSDIVHVDPFYLSDEIRKVIGTTSGSGAYAFKGKHLLSSLLSKYTDGSGSDEELRQAAFSTFRGAEVTCKKYNDEGLPASHYRIRDKTRMLIRRILGPFSYDRVLSECKHGSGATFSRKRAFGQAVYKYNTDEPKRYWSKKKSSWVTCPRFLACTPLAYKYWTALCNTTLWGRYGSHHNTYLVKGNKLDFVPKNNRTHRTIAKEPDINMVLQLGVGKYLAKRLSLFRNCKSDQTRNQRLAHAGSLYGHLATLDLSAASDSISWRIVYELLPSDWFQYLDDIRSHYYLDPVSGDWCKYEKFSTMGNGFTFELETVIFFALTLATANIGLGDHVGRVSCYGDDIICPVDGSDAVVEALQWAGFTVNPEKSFTMGPFRESCGKHYYKGVDVTPFYVRKPIDSVQRVVWLLNSLRKWAYDEDTRVCDDSFYELWLSLYKRFPLLKKLRGGRDPSRQDYVVSPGRPTGQLASIATRLTIDETSMYAVTLSQGYSEGEHELTPVRLEKDNAGRERVSTLLPEELYHYLIHPENQRRLCIIPNFLEHEHVQTEYKFLTELN